MDYWNDIRRNFDDIVIITEPRISENEERI